MEVILLERVAKLASDGRSRQSQGRICPPIFCFKRAGAARHRRHRAKFDGMKAEFEANNVKARASDQGCREDRRPNVVVLRQASETDSCSDR